MHVISSHASVRHTHTQCNSLSKCCVLQALYCGCGGGGRPPAYARNKAAMRQ